MERLTRPNVNVDETAAKFMGKEVNLQDINDRLLHLVLNGPILNAVNKDVLRQIIRQMYGTLKKYEDTGLVPEEVKDIAENAEIRLLTWFEAKYSMPVGKLMDLLDAHEQGRLVVLPCKVGDTVYMENGDDETPHFVDTGKVFAIGCDERGTIWISVRYESGLKFYHPSTDVGKTVFLIREEAERALKGGAFHE